MCSNRSSARSKTSTTSTIRRTTSCEQGGHYRVKAQTEIADFNRAFGAKFSDTDFDTVGGLVVNRFGRLPKRGEAITIDGLRVQVLRADSRRLHVLQVHRLPGKA